MKLNVKIIAFCAIVGFGTGSLAGAAEKRTKAKMNQAIQNLSENSPMGGMLICIPSAMGKG